MFPFLLNLLLLYFSWYLYLHSGLFIQLKALSKRLSFGTVVNLLIEVALVTPSENQFYISITEHNKL